MGLNRRRWYQWGASLGQIETISGEAFLVGIPSRSDERLFRAFAGPLAELDAMVGFPEGTASQALVSAPILTCVPASSKKVTRPVPTRSGVSGTAP